MQKLGDNAYIGDYNEPDNSEVDEAADGGWKFKRFDHMKWNTTKSNTFHLTDKNLDTSSYFM